VIKKLSFDLNLLRVRRKKCLDDGNIPRFEIEGTALARLEQLPCHSIRFSASLLRQLPQIKSLLAKKLRNQVGTRSMSSGAVRYAKDGSGVPVSTRRWTKDAFDALLLDDPLLDVDHERASKRSRDALKRVFAKPASRASSRAGSRFGATPFSKEKVQSEIRARHQNFLPRHNCLKRTIGLLNDYCHGHFSF